MSENYRNTTGLWSAGAFQSSGMPYTIAINPNAALAPGIKVTFPYVTNWIHVRNQGTTPVSMGFSQLGVQGATNVISIQGRSAGGTSQPENANPLSELPVMRLKLTELWFSGSSTTVYVTAGLTNIPTARINNSGCSPSGSNWSGSYDGIG